MRWTEERRDRGEDMKGEGKCDMEGKWEKKGK